MEETKNYKTKQKAIILEMLIKYNNQHLYADEMINILKEQQTPVSRATLYRFLDVLVSTGVVQKYVIAEKACYQYVGDLCCHNHYHLKCMDCGMIIHEELQEIDKIASKIGKKDNFTIDKTKIVFYGICENCRKERIKNEKDLLTD